MSKPSNQEYFEFLDDMREFGGVNMFAAPKCSEKVLTQIDKKQQKSSKLGLTNGVRLSACSLHLSVSLYV